MKKLVLFTEGTEASKDRRFSIEMPPLSTLFVDGDGNPSFIPSGSAFSNFSLLPNLTSLAAGFDPASVTIGTGTEVPTRATKGGARLQSQATSPADNDNVLLVGVAGTKSFTTFRAAAPPTFRTRINIAQPTLSVYGAGLDENITSPIPSGTAGDGAAFYFDPLGEDTAMVTALTSAAQPNWVLTQKVNGADTYINSGVPVVAGVDYELKIVWDSALKPSWYINGVLVGTSTTANTEGDAAKLNIGGQMNGTPGGLRVDMDVRYFQIDNGGLA